jgi:hypothetical protein
MRYLITTETNKPFFTQWFIPENNFNASLGMIVFDLAKNLYTIDGTTWNEIEIDHL